MKPAPSKSNGDSIVEASSTTKLAPTQSVWLAPAQAETHILSRTEPLYPPEALAAHRSGDVLSRFMSLKTALSPTSAP